MAKRGPERQDESGHMPLAVCHNGRVLAVLDPNGPLAGVLLDGNANNPLWIHMGEVAAKYGLVADDVEVLAICHKHPNSSAVDCLDCEPL